MLAIVRSALWWLHVAWIALNQLLCTLIVPRAAPQSRKIVVLGDSFAQGVGDWVRVGRRPGLAQYLDAHLASDQRVRFRWATYPCGWRATTSRDWLPAADGRLWQWALGPSSSLRDADVAVLIVGTHDASGAWRSEITPADTLANLRGMSRILRAQHKHVYVATAPTFGAGGPRLERLREGNRLVREWARSARDEVHGCIELDGEHNCAFAREDLFCADRHHLNSSGYRELAKTVARVIADDLVKIQFAFFRDLLRM